MKGKQAAMAARRRMTVTEDAMAVLKEKLAETKRCHNEELRHLRSRIVELEADILKKAEALAAERIEELKRRHMQAVAAREQRELERLTSLVKLFDQLGVEMPNKGWEGLCQIFGVQMGQIYDLAGISGSRAMRRASRTTLTRVDEIRSSGRGTAGVLSGKEAQEFNRGRAS